MPRGAVSMKLDIKRKGGKVHFNLPDTRLADENEMRQSGLK